MQKRGRKNGYAMIMVLCVMAIILALCLALLLTASIVFSSASEARRNEQCRILAVSLSQEFEKQITSGDYTFNSEEDENSGNDGTLWYYLKKNMQDGSWPYFNENERGHTSKYAYRSFKFDMSDVPEDVSKDVDGMDDIQVLMYWESESGASFDSVPLTIQVSCSQGKSTCTICSEYMLGISDIITEYTDEETGEVTTVSYEQWKWSLNWRE